MEDLGFAMKFPGMRYQLLRYLKSLSDLSYQKSCWVEHNCPDGVQHDEFDFAYHFLFDDTTLGTEPEEWIGVILRNREEAEGIRLLCEEIEEIHEKYGYDLTDAEYIAVPEWSNVLESAQSAWLICRSESAP